MPSKWDSCWRQTILPSSAVPDSLDEAREPDLGATRLTIRWADGCRMTHLLPDEVRDFYRPGVARGQAIQRLLKRHEMDLHKHVCGERHHIGTPCPRCDVAQAKASVSRQTGVHGLRKVPILPDWVLDPSPFKPDDRFTERVALGPPPVKIVTRRLW